MKSLRSGNWSSDGRSQSHSATARGVEEAPDVMAGEEEGEHRERPPPPAFGPPLPASRGEGSKDLLPGSPGEGSNDLLPASRGEGSKDPLPGSSGEGSKELLSAHAGRGIFRA